MSSTNDNEVIEKIKRLLKSDEALRGFFRNQQRFIHLYLLGQGCAVTSQVITDVMMATDKDRKLAPQTYYRLRGELEKKGWIYYVEATNNKPGQTEFPHKVKTSKLKEFIEAMIEISTIERPVSISKFHIFDMALRFSNQTGEVVNIADYLGKLEDTIFHPNFFVRELIGWVPVKKTINLSPWLNNDFVEAVKANWLDLQVILGVAKANAAFMTPSLKRAKHINLDVDHTVALVTELQKQDSHKIRVVFRVYPTGRQTYLPEDLQFTLLSESGEPLEVIQAGNNNNCIEQPLTGSRGDQFSVNLALGEVSVTENFVI